MEQNTLYRKYRPIDFDTVVGQDTIVTTLKNQIINDKVSHAYLFCGTRGTGKTTVAKIFARALNCEKRKITLNYLHKYIKYDSKSILSFGSGFTSVIYDSIIS